MAKIHGAQEHKTIRDLNKIGDRIKWIRLKLKMTARSVATSVGMPVSTFYDREQNGRTEHIEEYRSLSNFFNTEWQEKFINNYPEYDCQELKKITPMFLMFGEIDHEKAEIDNLRKVLIKTQVDSFRREALLNEQISILSDGVLK